jgi:RHS repeat-associated protein
VVQVIAAQTQSPQCFPVLPTLPAGISSLGTCAYLLENSRLGFAPQVPIWEPGFPVANQQNALGLRADVRQTRVGSRCTGKVRDTESGLDFLNARYVSSAQGRFTSPDPSNLSVDFWLPQTWNRYSYGLNDPLSVVDRNGLWPTYIHNEIIREAFHGMSKDQLQTLMAASHDTDYVNKVQVDGRTYGPQDPEASFVHSMSNGWDLMGEPWASEGMSQVFIQKNEQSAQQIQAAWVASGHTGIAPGALTAFGNALHTVTDATSPAHRGFQPWYGSIWLGRDLSHFAREAFIYSQSDRIAAIQAAQAAFYQTFGSLLPSWQSALIFGFQQNVPDVSSKVCFAQEEGPPVCQ